MPVTIPIKHAKRQRADIQYQGLPQQIIRISGAYLAAKRICIVQILASGLAIMSQSGQDPIPKRHRTGVRLHDIAPPM